MTITLMILSRMKVVQKIIVCDDICRLAILINRVVDNLRRITYIICIGSQKILRHFRMELIEAQGY